MRIFFICVGIVIILASLAWGVTVFQFITHASSAKGRVIKLNAGSSHPQIEFHTQDGKEIRYPQNGLIFGYQVGDEVNILYDAQNPPDASLNTFGALWGFPLLAFAMGIFFILVSCFSINSNERRVKDVPSNNNNKGQ